MRIGELARACSVNPKTNRYYEAFGLLPKAARAPSGHRIYSERDLQRLRFIRRAKGIGLPLTSIRQITMYADTGSCHHLRPRLKELIAAQLAEIEARIKELRALERELRGHFASLCQHQAEPPTGAPCSCLDTSPRKTAILPADALVRRPPRRKSCGRGAPHPHVSRIARKATARVRWSAVARPVLVQSLSASAPLGRRGPRRVFQILIRMIAMAPSRESHANTSP